jgi:hypothetical protein
MHIRRYIATGSFVVASLLALSACGGNKDGTAPSAPSTTAEPVVTTEPTEETTPEPEPTEDKGEVQKDISLPFVTRNGYKATINIKSYEKKKFASFDELSPTCQAAAEALEVVDEDYRFEVLPLDVQAIAGDTGDFEWEPGSEILINLLNYEIPALSDNGGARVVCGADMTQATLGDLHAVIDQDLSYEILSVGRATPATPEAEFASLGDIEINVADGPQGGQNGIAKADCEAADGRPGFGECLVTLEVAE